MTLYPKNQTAGLDPDLFRQPTAEYRGTPFWSWNNTLDQAQLLRQIGQLQKMGFGGFHMHARTGLGTPYLGDEFMGVVRACTERARDLGMLAWLYDEDRWPSGFAGGLVTQDERFRMRHLLWTCHPYNGTSSVGINISGARASRFENGTLLACYEVVIENGVLASYRRLRDPSEASESGRLWYAYLETALPTAWFNNQTYVDTLNPAAMARFLEVTHERYAESVGAYFGTVVPAIFTDEPQFVHKQSFSHAGDTADLVMPWTTDFLATYAQAYGQNLEAALPELFWELPGGEASLARYRYHDHTCERFASAFADTIGRWCRAHGLLLTGHMMEEPTLLSQTAALGEAMRSYRGFDLPGIDMLCDSREYTTAKQAQSAAHQFGCPGVLSELYGVTNWAFDFVGHKAQGDWQAALGVTVRVPHLTWVSMAGEAKRDYPASIGYQSPWYKEYPLIEDHFARVNTALTRGKPRVRVAVVHPIESYWLCFGPREQTKLEREEREEEFQNLTRWLLFGLIDFDFICESLLPSQSPGEESAQFGVGEMAYDVVLVPSLRTIRGTTLDRLEQFAGAGGTVIFAGDLPTLMDARLSDRAQRLATKCRQIALTRRHLLDALAPYGEVSVELADGGRAESLLYQMRTDGGTRYLFLCNTDKVHGHSGAQVKIAGVWDVTQLDTFTGKQSLQSSRLDGSQTVLDWDFPAHGSLLLSLTPRGIDSAISATTPKVWAEAGRLADPVPITLSEPNTLLLDQAEWRVNDEDWQPIEEVLRLGNLARAHVGLSPMIGNIAQPWTDTEPAPPLAQISLRFAIDSDIAVAEPQLALENPDVTQITLDDQPVPSSVVGWYVDEAIQTVALPPLAPGRHEITLTLPLTRKTPFEWCYLLGEFGVRVAGRYARLTAPVRELAFGDWTTQGLPFYAGNVTYHCALEGNGQDTAIHAPHFRAPLLSVTVDGTESGKIAFAPFQLRLGALSDGLHRLDITAFGNRANAFGSVHHTDPTLPWGGWPDNWRSTGDDWAYEYQIRPMGVLTAPIVHKLA